MTKDEALKMAIEAIEYTNWSERTAKMETALEACKEALEQTAQEPVAYKHEIFINGRCAETWYDDIKNPASDTKIIPLYTHPAPPSYQSNGKLSYSEELAYQTGFEAGREFERGCDD